MTSSACAVVEDVRLEVARINRILTDLPANGPPAPTRGSFRQSECNRRTSG